ncbi:hypothetical protein QJQ45_016815 [Haematococcus lacustris]|nr:hypothetical protein QJQ45_016815 [Haematococcus lacustris]
MRQVELTVKAADCSTVVVCYDQHSNPLAEAGAGAELAPASSLSLRPATGAQGGVGTGVAARAKVWQRVWVTDALDHNRDPVTALTFCAAIEGLSGLGSGAGWLISSGRHVMNLWAASAGGMQGAEASLMLAHSQATDLVSIALAAEPSLASLYACSTDTQVASLHSLGQDLRHQLVVMAATRVMLYEGAAAPLSSVIGLAPRCEWVAAEGGASLTALHASALAGGLVFTGATDGSVTVWNVKERRAALVRKLATGRHVTCLQLVNDTTLITGSADGQVLLWDMRASTAPRAAVSLDGSPVLHLEASPAGDCLAVATARGLHSLDLVSGTPPGPWSSTPITTRPLEAALTGLTWNWATNELYTAHQNGIIIDPQPTANTRGEPKEFKTVYATASRPCSDWQHSHDRLRAAILQAACTTRLSLEAGLVVLLQFEAQATSCYTTKLSHVFKIPPVFVAILPVCYQCQRRQGKPRRSLFCKEIMTCRNVIIPMCRACLDFTQNRWVSEVATMKQAAAAQGGRGDKRQRGHNGASKARADALAKTNKKSVSLRDRLRFLTHLLKKVVLQQCLAASARPLSLCRTLKGSVQALTYEDLTPGARTRAENELRAAQEQQRQAAAKERERKLAVRYHKVQQGLLSSGCSRPQVRFFERIKIERQIGQLHRKLQEAVEQGVAPEEVSEQQAVLEEWQRKLMYVRHFPPGEKYVSLLRQADSPDAQAFLDQERHRLHALVEAQQAAAAAAQADQLALTEADEGRAALQALAQQAQAWPLARSGQQGQAVPALPATAAVDAGAGPLQSKGGKGSNGSLQSRGSNGRGTSNAASKGEEATLGTAGGSKRGRALALAPPLVLRTGAQAAGAKAVAAVGFESDDFFLDANAGGGDGADGSAEQEVAAAGGAALPQQPATAGAQPGPAPDTGSEGEGDSDGSPQDKAEGQGTRGKGVQPGARHLPGQAQRSNHHRGGQQHGQGARHSRAPSQEPAAGSGKAKRRRRHRSKTGKGDTGASG